MDLNDILFDITTQIYIWQLKDQDLMGVAFIDTQVYVHRLCTIKNLILAADMCKSISLLRYQSDMKVLSLVSRVSFSPEYLEYSTQSL
jgi:cleavage and polyadenylation specificity factor subunit 1